MRRAFISSIANSAALSAERRCGDETATMTDAPQTGTAPVRCCIAIAVSSGQRALASTAIALSCFSAIAAYAVYSRRTTPLPSKLLRVVPRNVAVAPALGSATAAVTLATSMGSGETLARRR